MEDQGTAQYRMSEVDLDEWDGVSRRAAIGVVHGER